jgi:hypothetical protein
MTDVYELWIKWPGEDWKLFKSGNDIEYLRTTAKRIAKILKIDCKIHAVQRFEQSI